MARPDRTIELRADKPKHKCFHCTTTDDLLTVTVFNPKEGSRLTYWVCQTCSAQTTQTTLKGGK